MRPRFSVGGCTGEQLHLSFDLESIGQGAHDDRFNHPDVRRVITHPLGFEPG